MINVAAWFIDYTKETSWWWFNCVLQTAAINNHDPGDVDNFIKAFLVFYDEFSLPPSATHKREKRIVKIVYEQQNDKVKEGMDL